MSNSPSPKKLTNSAVQKSLDIKAVKQLNIGLAASAVQDQRDKALDKLLTHLGTEGMWFATDAEQASDKKPQGKDVKTSQHA